MRERGCEDQSRGKQETGLDQPQRDWKRGFSEETSEEEGKKRGTNKIKNEEEEEGTWRGRVANGEKENREIR